MTIDALAYEPHFLDHLAPVWNALPARLRGRFVVDPSLRDRAQGHGIHAIGTPYPKPIPAMPPPVFDGVPALVASYGDIKRGRRMGYGPFVFLEHGIAQSYTGDRRSRHHASYSGGQDRADTILNLVPNGHAAARWREAYPDVRTEIVGSPKLDTLPRKERGDSPVVAISFHFPCSVAPETRPAIGHYLFVLAELAKRYKVIGHAHPRFYGIDRTYRRVGIEYVPDFAEVCERADVYICDNSSTIYEFAATGRPVVVLNAPHYRRDIHHGLRFWEAANVGINVDHARDLIGAVGDALRDDEATRAHREAALDIVYAYRTGAAERAAAAIADVLAARELVAA